MRHNLQTHYVFNRFTLFNRFFINGIMFLGFYMSFCFSRGGLVSLEVVLVEILQPSLIGLEKKWVSSAK